jgi:adenylate cyclase
VERRLAAILAADVVGYARLMSMDETGTLQRLKWLRREVVQPAIAGHDGRIVKLMGDGLLAVFPSVVEAVQCAIDVQTAVAKSEADSPEHRRVRLRVGVNIGDVIVEGSDIYGDGVNIAARLEAIAQPGGICLSGDAFRQVRGKIQAAFEDLGERELKNLAEPVRVYSLVLDPGASGHGSPAATRPLQLDRPTIAVLPFANLSGDPEQEYFSDGLTEDLITEMSRFKEISVVSRNSSFAFKGGTERLAAIAEKLRANYVAEGSVRKAGARIRISAQLVDVQSDRHVWAERFDRRLEDIFEVQDDVVRCIVGAVVGRMAHERHNRTKRLSNDQLRAYDLYLRGREHFFQWSLEDNRKAGEALRTAIALEPDYAAALALLSEVLLRMWLNGWSDRPDDDLAEALVAAVKADELDDQDSRTQTALGMVLLFHRELDRARRHFEAALKSNPNDARALVYFSRHAVFDGDAERAVGLCQQALSLNPYGKYAWNTAIAHFVAHDYGRAIALLESIRRPAEAVLAVLAASHALAGDEAQATATAARFRDAAKESPVMSRFVQPAEWRDYFRARWPFRDPSDLDHLLGGLQTAGLPLR